MKKPKTNKVKKVKAPKKPVLSESDSDNKDREPSPERKPVAKKFKKQMIEKIAKTTDVKEVVVRKRMASLNASAMMAASYEVERQLDRCEAKMYKCSPETEEHVVTIPKKPKDIKDEVLETKDVRIFNLMQSF